MKKYYEGINKGAGGQTVLVIETDGKEKFSSKSLYHVVRHSPDGFQWGYGGSGPSDLALSMLTDAVGKELAEQYYQLFKADFIAGCGNHLVIFQQDILEWVNIISDFDTDGRSKNIMRRERWAEKVFHGSLYGKQNERS